MKLQVLYAGGSGLALALALGCSGESERVPGQQIATIQAELQAAVDQGDGTAQIILNLRPAPASATFAGRRAHNRRIQDRLLSEYAEGFTLQRRFTHVPALSGIVTREALDRLRHDPDVTYLQIDGTGAGQLKEAVPAIGADVVQNQLGLTGRGVRVAILDTGIVTTHPDLMSSVVAQHCFTQFDCPPSRGVEGTSAEDDHGHGSNVAGIITSDGVVAPKGFAPGAEIVAVKVDDANDAGRISDWVSGLDWVYENLPMLKVRVMNLSICSTQLYPDGAACDRGEPALAQAVKNLVDAGVTIFAASGNQGSSSTLSAPACNTGVIAVGAVYDASVGHQPPNATTYASRWGSGFANCGDNTTAFDQITCFTNSNARLDIVAPGAPMLSDSLGGRTETYWGTSQASPAAAGVAALMLECNPGLTPAQIKATMKQTGVPRIDPKNSLSFPSLRALDAVRSVCSNGGAGAGGAAGSAGAGGAGVAGAEAGGAGSAGGAGGASGAPGSGGFTSAVTGGSPPVVGAGGALSTGGASARGGAPAGVGGVFSAGGLPGVSSGGASLGANPFAGAAGQGSFEERVGCSCTVPRRERSSNRMALGLAGLGAGAVLRRRASKRGSGIARGESSAQLREQRRPRAGIAEK
jgi:MYXO-CTERM domain-containing protein